MLDNQLNWSDHIQYIVKKCKKDYILHVNFINCMSALVILAIVSCLHYTNQPLSIIKYNMIVLWNSASGKDKVLIPGFTDKLELLLLCHLM